MTEEVRIVNEQTGGEKGSKLARFDLIPARAHWELAEHYGKGSKKYEDRNWEKGYDWSLSIAAAERHLNLFKQGEDRDEETDSKHVIAVAWHMLALAYFMDVHPDLDSRPGRISEPKTNEPPHPVGSLVRFNTGGDSINCRGVALIRSAVEQFHSPGQWKYGVTIINSLGRAPAGIIYSNEVTEVIE